MEPCTNSQGQGQGQSI